MPRIIIKKEGWKCLRCDHPWIPKSGFILDSPPITCPNCNNARWNIPKKEKEGIVIKNKS